MLTYFFSCISALMSIWRSQSQLKMGKWWGKIGHKAPLVKTTISIFELEFLPKTYRIQTDLKYSSWAKSVIEFLILFVAWDKIHYCNLSSHNYCAARVLAAVCLKVSSVFPLWMISVKCPPLCLHSSYQSLNPWLLLLLPFCFLKYLCSSVSTVDLWPSIEAQKETLLRSIKMESFAESYSALLRCSPQCAKERREKGA